MVTRLMIENFRGVQKANIELAPMTVLIGPNNAGKSTVIYALLTLKNIVVNPNQPLDSFFNFGFLNLGGFKQTVFVKNENLGIYLGVEVKSGDVVGQYGVGLKKQAGTLQLRIANPFSLSLDHEVTFPYALNLSASGSFEYKGRAFQVTWNGLTSTAASSDGQAADSITSDASYIIGYPPGEIRKVDIVPLRRGFSKPVYAAVPVPPQVLTEDEIATVLATDSDLLGRVDFSLEKILNRSLRVFVPPQTASFYLQIMNRETGMMSELVNEGFGTNQLVFLLAKLYRDGCNLLCIEEPEIHLHPSAISNFMDRVAHTAQESLEIRRRQFLISTHSEHVITPLLGFIAKGRLKPEDVALYYISRKQYETVIERCEISEKGQVKGGLRGFYEAELAAVKNLLDTTNDE